MTTPPPPVSNPPPPAPSPSVAATAELVLTGRSGLHARPAARVVEIARRYAAAVTLTHGATRASAKDLLDVLYLAAPFGAMLVIAAEGFDAAAAVEALATYLASMGDDA